ncbi:hypothetical protein EJ04DRAFT_497531 [Polyplosphaeria fusca]|uniref:Uncharacterized protein n=1 Tax=Polyplosphaeria fusca TaxID=682080 RepID=A0A9P4QVL2_9PLEO|nr:hypothetical protein EJ04DRAFT_497531 [Polyplosphaeria fusca]
MHLPSLLSYAALAATAVHADFFVITENPIPASAFPTNLTNSADTASYTSSVLSNFGLAWGLYIFGQGASYSSTKSSIQSEVASWASTATRNYSIPAEVPATGTTVTITTKPDWYTALPSAVRSYKESEQARQKSILNDVLGLPQTDTSLLGGSGVGGSRSSGWAAPARATGRVGLGAAFGMAAGAAAVFL